MTTTGMIEYLKKNIKSIKFPLTNIEGEVGFHTVNNLFLDEYNKLYIDYTTFKGNNYRTQTAELNSFFISNIYKKALNQILKEIWND